MYFIVHILWFFFIILISDAATRPIVPFSRSSTNMEYNVEKNIQKIKLDNNIKDITMLKLFHCHTYYWESFIILFLLTAVLFMILILYYNYFRTFIGRLCPTFINWFDEVLEIESSFKPYILDQVDNNYYVLELCA